MFKSQCMILCVTYFIIGAYSNAVPFIVRCKWDDKACLISSTKAALPIFAKGIPEHGVPPMDPMKIEKAAYQEGTLKIDFKNMTVTGARNCEVNNVERNLAESSLLVEAECPIHVDGTYDAIGSILSAAVEGSGPFHVHSKNIFISVKVGLTTVDGDDGQKHWKIGKNENSFEVREESELVLENLFNGDQEKAAPITAVLKDNWKVVMETCGKPVVEEIIHHIISSIQNFALSVPASALEL